MTGETTTRAKPPRWAYSVAVATAAVAGVFVLAVCVVMAVHALRLTLSDPLDAPEFRVLQAELRQDPANEQLKERIRVMDLVLREEYFRRRQALITSGFLLACGVAAFLSAAHVAAYLKRRPPAPPGPDAPGRASKEALAARRSVAAVAVLIGAAALVGAIVAPVRPLQAPPQTDGVAGPVAQPPSEEELRRNWPGFRGYGGSGISPYANVPASWDAAGGRNIAWKTPVPLPGHSSPVVWEGKVFLTGARALERKIFCFDAAGGGLLWTLSVKDVPGSPAAPPQVMEDTGYAAPTGATDGRWFFAIFANGDVVCADFTGKRVWARNLGAPDNAYGYAASLRLHEDLLLVVYDQGRQGDGKSVLYALDAATGRTVYRQQRPVANSWTSPIVIRAADRDQCITAAEPWIISHDPATGSILWQVAGIGPDVAPSPIFAGGLVLAVSVSDTLFAVRPDGNGDVTDTHVAWRTTESVPDICSPVANDELLWTLTTYGTLSCFETKTGKPLWAHNFETPFRSSPSLAGDRLYVTAESGKTFVVAAAREFRLLGEADLGEPTNCSFAFADGRIFSRGREHLFCIAERPHE